MILFTLVSLNNIWRVSAILITAEGSQSSVRWSLFSIKFHPFLCHLCHSLFMFHVFVSIFHFLYPALQTPNVLLRALPELELVNVPTVLVIPQNSDVVTHSCRLDFLFI